MTGVGKANDEAGGKWADFICLGLLHPFFLFLECEKYSQIDYHIELRSWAILISIIKACLNYIIEHLSWIQYLKAVTTIWWNIHTNYVISNGKSCCLTTRFQDSKKYYHSLQTFSDLNNLSLRKSQRFSDSSKRASFLRNSILDVYQQRYSVIIVDCERIENAILESNGRKKEETSREIEITGQLLPSECKVRVETWQDSCISEETHSQLPVTHTSMWKICIYANFLFALYNLCSLILLSNAMYYIIYYPKYSKRHLSEYTIVYVQSHQRLRIIERAFGPMTFLYPLPNLPPTRTVLTRHSCHRKNKNSLKDTLFYEKTERFYSKVTYFEERNRNRFNSGGIQDSTSKTTTFTPGFINNKVSKKYSPFDISLEEGRKELYFHPPNDYDFDIWKRGGGRILLQRDFLVRRSREKVGSDVLEGSKISPRVINSRKGRFGNEFFKEKTLHHTKLILMMKTTIFMLIFSSFFDSAAAVCPSACVCKWKNGKQTVECMNKGLDAIPGDIDPGTQVLDLTGNPLVIIPQKKFEIIGLTNLQRIYVAQCKLFQLDDTAFLGLSNLVELDLSKNELRIIPIGALRHLTLLMRLQMSNNPFKEVKNRSFKRLEYLKLLDLSSCSIERIEPLGFEGLDKLEWLKLENNKISTVPYNIVLPKSLLGIRLHKNPWNCNCKLKKLQVWMTVHSVPTSVEPKCSKPPRLRFREIRDIKSDEFACVPEVRPSSLFLDVLEGKNVSFECHVNSIPNAEISWKFNGNSLENTSFAYDEATSLYVLEEGELSRETVSYLRIETVTEAHNGVFQCHAQNKAGKSTSNFTLRVSVLSTTQPPKIIVIDKMIYIGVALVLLTLLIVIVVCLLVIRCCRKRSQSSKRSPNMNISIGNAIREKDGISRPRTGNMPKYIQMGTPAPKVNGISEFSSISVIENSPYRNDQSGSSPMNPDLIADGPNDRNKMPKKKVSIISVEEMDANGVITTRRLDDIIEEVEEVYDPTYEQLVEKNLYCENANNAVGTYSDGRRQNVSYPLATLQPTDPPQYYEQQVLPIGYGTNMEMRWEDTKITRNEGFRPIPSEQIPVYATIKRNRRSPSPRSLDLLHDQKYPEQYNMPPCNNHCRPPDSRYHQNYGVKTQQTSCGNGAYCECYQGVPEHNGVITNETLERIRGDGCSFDNLLSSCGGQCCYNEQTGQLFENTLPENYRPLEPNPPPPAGYGDSEDEDATQKVWEDDTLSPGTRILYSPEEKIDTELVKQSSLNDSTSDA